MKQEPLKKYYQNNSIAGGYMRKRFSSIGGKFVNQSEISSLINLLPTNLENISVTDLGAGTGRLTNAVLNLNPKSVIAIDSSEEMLKSLREISSNKLKIYKRSAEKTQLKPESIDIVMSLRLFEHLNNEHLIEVIQECNRILKRKGSLIFNTVGLLSAESVVHRFLKPSSSPVYPISPDRVVTILKQNGFKISDKKQILILPRGLFMHSPYLLFYLFYILETLLEKTALKSLSSHHVWKAIKK